MSSAQTRVDESSGESSKDGLSASDINTGASEKKNEQKTCLLRKRKHLAIQAVCDDTTRVQPVYDFARVRFHSSGEDHNFVERCYAFEKRR